MKENKIYVQECGECESIWFNDSINTRCPRCGSYEVIVDVEWEEVDG